MKDSWCRPLQTPNGKIYGGAARNKRIAHQGGMDKILSSFLDFVDKNLMSGDSSRKGKVIPLSKKNAA